MFKNKSKLEEIPLWMGIGSSTHHPERKGGISTCDIVQWCRFGSGEWFRPYGGFNQSQVEKMIETCVNDQQVERLIEMLMCKPA